MFFFFAFQYLLMELAGLCDICGMAGKLNTCILCGRRVCGRCYLAEKRVCVACAGGRAIRPAGVLESKKANNKLI